MVFLSSRKVFEDIDTTLVDFYVASLLIIVFFSLLANIIVLTALYTQKANLRNSMDVFIANVAVSDIISSFSATFTLNNAKLRWSSGSGTCKMCYYLVFVSYAVTTVTLCLASVDRFYGICLPTKHRQVLLKKQSISICLIWILSCLLFAPYIYAYEVKEFKLSSAGKTEQICTLTWSSDSQQIFYSLVMLLLLFLAPIVLFIFVFVKVCHKLQEPRSTASGGNAILHKKRKQMTFMLLLMIASQYVCWGPAIIGNTAHIFGIRSRGYFNIWLLFELLHFLRSIIYPLIYIAMYKNFRASVKALLSFCCSAASQTNSTITTSATNNLSQPSSVPVSSAASDRSASYVPEDDLYTTM